jgi:hypothetical protein
MIWPVLLTGPYTFDGPAVTFIDPEFAKPTPLDVPVFTVPPARLKMPLLVRFGVATVPPAFTVSVP